MKKNLRPFLIMTVIAALVALGLIASPASADTLTIVSTNGTYIDQAVPNKNYGSGTSIIVRGTTNQERRGLVEFNVAGLPAGVTANAEIGLYARSTNQVGTVRTQASGAFAEGTVTWNTRPTLDPAILGSVVTPSSGLFSVPAGTVSANGLIRFALTAPAGATPNMIFGSDEYGSSGGPERPRLILTYSIPTTTTVAPTTTTIPPTTTTVPPPPSSFPQGIWTSGSDSGMTDPELVQIKNLGYDFVQINPVISVLDRVHAAGLKANIWLGNYRDDNDSGSPPCEFITDDATLTTQINLVKDHPATFAYFVADEPHVGGCPNSPAQMLARHNLIRSLDPNLAHKTIISENRAEDYAALANTTDVLAMVAYPCNLNNIANDCVPSTTIAEHITAANAAGVEEYWSMPQIDGDEYYRVATPTALQTAIYDRWRTLADPTKHTGALTFLWDGCSSCDGLANHRELDSVVLAENTNN